MAAAFVELFGAKLQRGKDTVDTADALAGKAAVFVYFSAHWCPPCRGFTPELAKLYKRHAASKNFECVFVSSDRDNGSFAEYFAEQPWLALPFDERKTKTTLSEKYGVNGIPSLVILDGASGDIITKSGRGAVMGDQDFNNFPFHPQPVGDLTADSEASGFDLNEKPSLIAFIEGCDDDAQADAKAALLAVAKEINAKGGEPNVIFFHATSPTGLVKRVRELLGAKDARLKAPRDDPLLVMLNVQDEAAFYVSDATDCTEADVRAFASGWASGKRQSFK